MEGAAGGAVEDGLEGGDGEKERSPKKGIMYVMMVVAVL